MLYTLTASSWSDSFSPVEQKSATQALEEGKVLYLPNLAFPLAFEEKTLLNPNILEKNFKNISFDPKTEQLQGNSQAVIIPLQNLLRRFFKQSRDLLTALAPTYEKALLEGRTSFRPIEVKDRKTSLLKDDKRLHVDAFPATPNQGKRILRIFTNINPIGEVRLWHLGEPFERVVKQFSSRLSVPLPGIRNLLLLLNLTKSYRTLYDHYMLKLHNTMKKDDQYQSKVNKKVVNFPAGATWIVMTDCVSHAALSGQYLLEQTFYLPVEAMDKPERSPLYILEKTFRKNLIDR